MTRCSIIAVIRAALVLGFVGVAALLAQWGLAGASPALAQQRVYDPAQMQRNYEKKLKSRFLSEIEWSRTIEEARELAREKDLPILGYFTRSFSP